MKVSVILPTYNEAGNIVALVNAILKVMPASIEPEVLVVDDNSPDGTYQLAVDRFRDDARVVTILRTKDRGFAKSIREGIERSTGQKVIVMDTDFTHDPEEIPRLLHLSEVYDLVIGSRFCAGGNMQDALHYHSSLLYNWMLRIILRTQVQDNLGGYFIASRKLLSRLPFDAIFFGYGDYFFRFLYFAQQTDTLLVEIPAQYRARTAGTSKSRVLSMLTSYSLGALRLRLSHPPRQKKVG